MCYLSPYTGASIVNEASKMKGCLWHYNNLCINGKLLDNDWTARINNNDRTFLHAPSVKNLPCYV